MSKWVEVGVPCPCGQSSDALSIDKGGNAFCFRGGCEKFFKDYRQQSEGSMQSDLEIEKDYHPWRGINLRTLQFYDVKTKFVNGEPIEVGFAYPNGGVQIRKINPESKKDKFRIVGPVSEAGLWRMDKFDPGALDSVTISEGHIDAMTMFQVTAGRTASLAVRSASTAYNELKQEKTREYLNSFKKIILCFDGDAPGQEAAKHVASLFDFRKVYFVQLNRYKDPNEYLEAGEGDLLYKSWENARRFSPDNIINSFKDIESILAEKQDEMVGTYPIKALQDNLKGFHRGEFVLVKAPEGVGKSELFHFCEYHLLKTQEHPVGVMHFEESNNNTIRGVVTYQLEAPAAMEDSEISDEEVMEAYKALVRGREDLFYIRRSYDIDDTQGIIDSIRYMVAGCGCRVVFFDHISWLAAANETDDERKKLDALSQKLKLLAEELHFCIVVISHVNDEGKTRGSRYISKVANTVIALSRDITSLDFNERMKTYFTVEKGRGQGTKTGPAGHAYYDINTYTLKDGTEFEEE